MGRRAVPSAPAAPPAGTGTAGCSSAGSAMPYTVAPGGGTGTAPAPAPASIILALALALVGGPLSPLGDSGKGSCSCSCSETWRDAVAPGPALTPGSDEAEAARCAGWAAAKMEKARRPSSPSSASASASSRSSKSSPAAPGPVRRDMGTWKGRVATNASTSSGNVSGEPRPDSSPRLQRATHSMEAEETSGSNEGYERGAADSRGIAVMLNKPQPQKTLWYAMHGKGQPRKVTWRENGPPARK